MRADSSGKKQAHISKSEDSKSRSGKPDNEIPCLHKRVAGLVFKSGRVDACGRGGMSGPQGPACVQTFPTTRAGVNDLIAWVRALAPELVAIEQSRSPDGARRSGNTTQNFLGIRPDRALERVLRERLAGASDQTSDVCVRICLVDTHYFKQVPGRPHGMSDACWLARLVSHGLYRPVYP